MSSVRELGAVVFAAALIACAGSHSRGPGEAAPDGGSGMGGQHVVAGAGSGGASAGQSGTAPSAGIEAGAGGAGAASGAGAGGMPGPRGVAAADASPVVPEHADTGVGMWVGELWYYVPVLCDPNMTPGDVPMMVPGGHRERVVLILDSDGEELEGRIAFGEGELPSAPAVLPVRHPEGLEFDPFWGCTNYVPAVGGVYEVRSAVQRQGRLTFEIATNEIWKDWCRRERYICPKDACEGGLATCTCDGDVCAADVSRRMVIDLTAQEDVLEGILHFQHYTPELRLRRVQ